MNQATFTAVDEYIKERVGLEDQILIKIRESGNRSTMPEANISPNQGKLLNILARARSAKNILELGTLVGYSTVWLARALPSGGKLITIEYDETNYKIAKTNFKEANLDEIITIKHGKALEILAEIEREQAEPFDFVFIDADKPPYVEYLKWAIKLSRKGSLIVLDNVIRNAKVLETDNNDPKVVGVRKLNDYLKDCHEADFTILQTIGEIRRDGHWNCKVVPSFREEKGLMESSFGEYKISTDKELIPLERLTELLHNTYWAHHRNLETIATSLENSICFGVYHQEKMVGFARVVTDYATMYWLCDVVIDPEYRGRDLGKKLIQTITEMDDLKEMFGILATRDAHGLYEKYGFQKVPDKFMRRNAKPRKAR